MGRAKALVELETDKITVEVPIHPVGVAIGVKDGGGILEMIHRTLEIRCLPTAIPASIDVDVTALKVGQSIHISELKAPEGCTFKFTADYVVAFVAVPEARAAALARSRPLSSSGCSASSSRPTRCSRASTRSIT